jgi:hypothetical protein
VFVVLVLALAVLCAVVVARLGAVAADRAQARTAADAAALAAVHGGDAAAAAVAAANGATVTDLDRQGAEVVVSVRVGDVEASARAGPG